MYLLGKFDARKYLRANKSAKQEMAPPRPGKFDEEGYRWERCQHPFFARPEKHHTSPRHMERCMRQDLRLTANFSFLKMDSWSRHLEKAMRWTPLPQPTLQ